MGIWRKLLDAQNRAAAKGLDPKAREVKTATGGADFASFDGHRYCLLVSFRRNGEAVPTPVWVGLDDGRLYAKTDATSPKARRVQRDARVLVAPCNRRGTPLGPAVEGSARVLPQGEVARAERALKENQGPDRRVFNVLTRPSPVEYVYIEITPAAK